MTNKLLRYRNRILFGDCLQQMRRLPEASIPLIVTSPPYNLRNTTGNSVGYKAKGRWHSKLGADGYDGFDDALPYSRYVAQQRDFLHQCMRLLTPNGSIFYNHKWRVQAGLLQDRHDIVEGFPVRQIIIWRRKGGINFNPGYFLPTFEVIYLIAKPEFRLAKGANRQGDIWEITQELRNPHPAPFPVELAQRCIESTDADVVLDPYMGSGTTAVAALEAGRDFIGIERASSYQQMAWRRYRTAHLEKRSQKAGGRG